MIVSLIGMKETSNPRAYNGTKLTTLKVEQCYFCEVKMFVCCSVSVIVCSGGHTVRPDGGTEGDWEREEERLENPGAP